MTATRDPDDGHVYLTARAEGRDPVQAVAIQGMCGKYVTSHWRVRGGSPVHYPELRIRVMDWLEREYPLELRDSTT